MNTGSLLILNNLNFAVLGDDIYQWILLDLSNFGLSLRTLACVLRVCKKFKSGKVDIDYSLEKNIADAFCILVKADQSRFKPQNVKYLMKAECGVLFFIRHIVEIQNIFTSPHAVYLESNSVLLKKLFDFCHVQRGENRFQLNNIHNNGKITRNLLVNGSFATIFPNINMRVNEFINDCVVCRKVRMKRYEVKLGDRYTKVVCNIRPFECVAVDPLGQISIKPFKNAKKKMSVYPLTWKCQQTGCIYVSFIEDLSRESAMAGIRNFVSSVGCSPKVLVTDSQNQFCLSTINPVCVDGLKLIPNMEYKKMFAFAQSRDYAEVGVKLLKSTLNTFIKRNNYEAWTDVFSNLTLLEVQTLFSQACYTANSMPYSDVSGLTPNHLLYPRWEHCRVSDAQVPMNSQQYHTKFIEEYQSFCDALEEEFLHVLQSNESRFREKYFARNNKQASHITAKTGDLVTWFEANIRKLGVIESITSHNSCIIKT